MSDRIQNTIPVAPSSVSLSLFDFSNGFFLFPNLKISGDQRRIWLSSVLWLLNIGILSPSLQINKLTTSFSEILTWWWREREHRVGNKGWIRRKLITNCCHLLININFYIVIIITIWKLYLDGCYENLSMSKMNVGKI